ncbi:MAG: hypothetical protein ACHQZR_09315 [Candidatus Limnocylindrales bacterium]
MHSSVAAIRGARVSARFVRPSARHRQRQLGLQRPDLTRAAASALVHPVAPTAALVDRLHGRHGMVVAAPRSGGPAPLDRRASFHWATGPLTLLRRPRPYRAAPWRG